MEQTAFSPEPSVRKLFNHGLTRRKAARRPRRYTRMDTDILKRKGMAQLTPQPNGNAFNAETPRTQRAAELFP
jgi:hypothetical protein